MEDRMRATLRPLLTIALGLLFVAAASAGQLERRLLTAKDYPGSRDRQYQVFVPTSYDGRTPVPMIMVLHGCRQTEANMINETRFRDLAERDGFIVVYPFITSFDGLRNPNCWGFFLDQHVHQGAGEVEDLHQVALEVEAAFRIDRQRRYVTGLSSGAGMAVVLATAYSEYFAAAGSVAGLPYSETSSTVGFVCANPGIFKPVSAVIDAMRAEQRRPGEQRPVPIMAIHSNNDCTVNPLGSRNIRDSWLRRYGASQTAVGTASCTAEGVACTHTRYGTAQRSVVETVFYEGQRGDITGAGSHYWVGDNRGEFANPTGPSATDLLWTFFRGHPFAEHPPPTVAIGSASASGTSVTVAGTASAPAGSSIAEVTVRLEGSSPQPQQTASGTTNWTVIFDNLPDNRRYTPVATVKDSDGLTTSVTGTPVVVGTVLQNEPPTAAVTTVSVAGDCVTLAGTAADTDGTVARVTVELGTRGPNSAILGGSGFQYQECGLPSGTYATRAVATDDDGARSAAATGPSATVSPLETISADWQAHMVAGRLRIYGAPCRSIGFGACDSDFAELFLAHRFAQFPLHRRPPATDWYEDPQNIR
jgi:poly(hydroxyalkanoate) depolymerase family esterase